MLGSIADAQDVVQDAYLRWHDTERGAVREPRAFLTSVVTRLCLDVMKSARARRETYVGQWLPEPLVEPLDIEAGDTIDAPMALMLALERLSPLERAAFLLHDVLDVDFPEIAAILERSEPAVRQLAARARANVRTDRKRFSIAADEAKGIAAAFFAAVKSGDPADLKRLLAESAIFRADGGGKVLTATRSLVGAEPIAQFLAGFARKEIAAGVGYRFFRPAWINGLPGYVTIEFDGTLQTTAFEIEDGLVTAVYVMRNPDKLATAAALVRGPT